MRRDFLLLPVAALAMLAGAEILLRLRPDGDLPYRFADKELHCVDRTLPLILLCPDATVTLRHPSGLNYTIHVNGKGERITRPRDAVRSGREIWLLGDSIAMGYGLDDDETAAWKLSLRTGRPVRNMAVDALGSTGVLALLRRSLPAEGADLFWIFHHSDFVDDPRDAARMKSPLGATPLRIHFFLSRHSALYNRLRYGGKNGLAGRNSYAPPTSLPAENHPTFESMGKIIHEARSAGLRLRILLYPDGERKTGTPLPDRTLTAFVRKRIREMGGISYDLTDRFVKASANHTLYIPEDGHPSAEAGDLFAGAMAEILEREENHSPGKAGGE